ncbi:MAG: hypothetical protein GYB36_14160 [Alphaproteobacteria bacterium]|nr:hypothetical protein [Alphaproteobacteria bacterium]
MSANIHFEVFLKKNKKASWALFDAVGDRDSAIRLAHSLMAQHKDGSVRVSKENFTEDKTFQSVTVFQGGAEKFGQIKDKENEARIPCLTPDDLAKSHARDTIRRALGSWLDRKAVLPMELLHRPDLVEDLEAAGTEMQHAVQKVAVASARDEGAEVHGLVKQLNDLVQRSLSRIYKDERNNRLRKYPKGKSFAEVAAEIHGDDGRAYALRSAIADKLKSAKNFNNKLDALLDMTESLPDDEAARAFALSEVDAYLADVLSVEGGRDAMLGSCKDLGDAIERLVCLFDGDHDAGAIMMAPMAARRIAKLVGKDMLPDCRGVIARNLLKDLERPVRLRPSSVKEEVRLARELARKLVTTADAALPTDQLIKSFTMRSARLLQPDTIDDYLRYSNDANEELDRLIALEENIVGDHNKEKLAGYIRAALGTNKTEQFFVRGDLKPLESLSLLTAHQTKVAKGAYPAKEKANLCAALDQLGLKILDDTKILHMIDNGKRPALDTAQALLKLATAGALPLGECSGDAQARALRQIKSDMGMKEAQAPDARDKLMQIQVMLQDLTARKAA